jgi:hypothetical protein
MSPSLRADAWRRCADDPATLRHLIVSWMGRAPRNRAPRRDGTDSRPKQFSSITSNRGCLMNLTPEFTNRVKTEGPLPETKGSARRTAVLDRSEAQLEGPRINAKLAAPGSDWMNVSSDGFWRPDVRLPFITDDGETVLLHYTGLVEQTDKFKQAATADQSTDWGDQYMRLAMNFDTGALRYRWLNTSLFIARGRLLGTGSIEYECYWVT